MECPSCRHWNPQATAECEVCHEPVPPERQSSSTGNLRLMLHCDACGVQNHGRVTVCAGCGSPLSRRKLTLKAPMLSSRDREIVHYLICPPLTPIHLDAEGSCIIGRADDANVSLPGELVSRHHARVVGHAGGYTLEDLGSANGTFRNASRLDGSAELKDDDRISVGGFYLRYVVRQGRSLSNSSVLRDSAGSPTRVVELEAVMAAAVESEIVSSAPSFAGLLDEVPLVAVLEFLRDHSHSGQLCISTAGAAGDDRSEEDAAEGQPVGSIRFGGGDIVDATSDVGSLASTGREAIFQLAGLRHGSFTFQQEEWDGSRELSDATGLILQALQSLASK